MTMLNNVSDAITLEDKSFVPLSCPITSWEIDGDTVETVSDFNFWAPKSLQIVTVPMKLKHLLMEGKFWPT